MKIFLISPVRTASLENIELIKKYVEKLEREDHQVHWPIRDTEQNDPTGGINICDTNLKKLFEADEIHVWYFKESSGTHFDLGGVYVLIRILGYKKRVVFVNKNDFTQEIAKSEKSFLKVLNFLDKESQGGQK